MSTRTAATRYAKALLDVAGSHAADLERSLTAFSDLLASNAELRHALLSPSVSAAHKRAIATTVAQRQGMPAPGITLIQLLADRDRLHLTSDLLTAYRERLLERQKIVKAQLRSATPLSSADISAIEARLGAVTGKNVSVEAAVDPELIGGVVATVGSTVYDGSVKSQLERLRRQLLASS